MPPDRYLSFPLSYAYCTTGELQHQWGARTYEVSYTYDSQGRKKTMTTGTVGSTGACATTTWNYDEASGSLVSKRYADNTGPTYAYTPAGRLSSRTWARTASNGALVTSYGHNFAGDLTSITYSDGTTPTVTLDHDRLGRLTGVSDATGSRTFTNTPDGQVAAEAFTSGSFAGAAISRTFDGLLRTGTLSVQPSSGASAIVQTIGYDSAARYQSFTQGSLSATYSYEPNSSLIAGILFQNSGTTTMTTAKTYDHLNRLQSISSGVGSSVVSSHAYLYNSANQRTRATLADGSYWAYAYDNLGQVTAGNKHWSDGNPVEGQQFGYAFDGIGNRTSTTTNGRPLVSYNSNALNQYTARDVPGTFDVIGSAAPTASVTIDGTATTKRHGDYFAGTLTVSNTAAVYKPVTITGIKAASGTNGADVVTTSTGSMFVAKHPEVFTYDLDGNLTSDGRWTYTWDAENRLIQMDTITTATNCLPAQRLNFIYDWQGRRSEKILAQWNTDHYETVTTTRFLYDGWNLVAELDGNNAPVRSYLWGLDLSGSPQGAGGVGGLLAMTTGTQRFVYAFDGNGNVAVLQSATGSPVNSYEYGPFGEAIRVASIMPVQNPFRFATKHTDTETGHIYYGKRNYIPGLGRWLNRDPIKENGGINIFAGCGNNMICRIDTNGSLDFWTITFDSSDSLSSAAVVDPNSIQSHSTEWINITDANNPEMYNTFKVLKAGVAFRVAEIAGAHAQTVLAAIAADYLTDFTKLQFRVEGKSLIERDWYGRVTYSLTLSGIHRSIDYWSSGADERVLIEANESYRILCGSKQIWTSGPDLLPPFQKIEDFLKQAERDPFPEHDVD